MAHQAADSLPQVPRSFAGVLADVAVPEKKFLPARDLEGLEDDVVCVSYEQALRSRNYASPGKRAGWAVASRVETKAEADRDLAAPQPDRRGAESVIAADCTSKPASRKSASVTVRLSQDESERLHQRAEEAGMTVSAYLRSCAFEVEALRAEVKATLTRLRSENAATPADDTRGAASRGTDWWHGLLSRIAGRNSR